MRTYFASRISDSNLRNVMKVTTALASGAGSKCHTKHDGVFCEGRPIDMSTDFHALRIEANEWLHPDDDPGHGWRLDHPIGKLCIFQPSCLPYISLISPLYLPNPKKDMGGAVRYKGDIREI